MKKWHYVILCVIFLSLGTVLALPLFQRKSLLSEQQTPLLRKYDEDNLDVGSGTIINDSITWQNKYGRLTVTPHTSSNLTKHTQYAEFVSNITKEVDVAFRFNDSLVKKDIWIWANISHDVRVSDYGWIEENYSLYNILDIEVINETVAQEHGLDFGDIPSNYYRRGNATFIDGELIWEDLFYIGFDSFEWLNQEHTNATFYYTYWGVTSYHVEQQYWFDWKNIKHLFTHQEYNEKHYYYITQWAVKNQTYNFKWEYYTPIQERSNGYGSNGKWDLMAKLHNDTIPEALSSGRYVMIDPWWNSNWNNRRLMSVNNSMVNTNLTDFPNCWVIDQNSSFYDKVNSTGGEDIVFIDWEDNTTQLAHEIEYFNHGGGVVDWTIWINVSVYQDRLRYIWVYYNNSAVGDQSNPTGTWGVNFTGVWHLSEGGTGLRYDSTSNDRDATTNNYDNDEQILGYRAYADDFDGTNDYLNYTEYVMESADTGTMSCWTKLDLFDGYNMFLGKWDTDNYVTYYNGATDLLRVQDDGSSNQDWTYSPSTGIWYYVTIVLNSTHWEAYINASSQGTATVDANQGIDLTLIGLGYSDTTHCYGGIIDEVRISSIKRNFSWINASYYTMVYPMEGGWWYDIGAEETVSIGRNWQQIQTWNFSYSNTSDIRYWNQTQSWNFSYSNTTVDRQIQTWNFSYSNTSAYDWYQIQTWNFSYSNTTNDHQIQTWNFSYSNTSRDWRQIQTWNFSYSNSTPPLAWYQLFTWNFSYSNSTPPLFTITNQYPINESFIYDLQPTVFFTLSHPFGNLMNYTVYTGDTAGECIYELATGTNVDNGTYNCNEYYNATNYTRYWYRIAANDGTEWVNESLYFNCSTEPRMISGNGLAIGVAMAASMLAIGFIFIIARRRNDGV